MSITWTKKFSSSDDGSILSGTQIGTIQDDISSQTVGVPLSTAGTVLGSALTSLTGIPAGAGIIPTVNLPTASASNALSGSIVQTVNTLVKTSTTGTTIFPFDDTVPQNTEGDQYMSLAITPNNASNLLIITVVINLSHSNNSSTLGVGLFQDSTAAALDVIMVSAAAGSNQGASGTLVYYMTAGTTSSTTFKIRAGGSLSGTTTFNGASSARIYGGVMSSTILIQEIKI